MDRVQEDLRGKDPTDADVAAPTGGPGDVPDLRLERFFFGAVRGYGIFQDRFGNLRQEFTVDTVGTWDGDVFLLDEDFRFRDGKAAKRLWRVRVLDDLRYEATADDIVGTAHGLRDGRSLRWRYILAVPVGARIVNMRFDDRMFLQEDGVLINLSDARKWGIRLGRLAASFQARP